MMTELQVLFANHLMATLFTGFIWYIQVVHYPIFLKISPKDFPNFHAFHTQGTGYVVAVPMVIELGLSLLLVWLAGAQVSLVAALALLALTLFIWGVTFFWAIPIHNLLETEGFHEGRIRELIRANAYRTAAWTIRFLMLSVLLYHCLR
ncbi:hypothetical protein [Eisenibacter elegans]|jgi:hypothetical protein|uniref:hypothetical protein n=1 Tax=Eisenibacter elegans TaxID=997 RepID=UPI00042821E9|nr:hypothetical protein [Eisenibacter elegans]